MSVRLICTVVAAVLVAGCLFAQSSQYKVNVPFAFEAGGKSLPAGEYRLNQVLNGVLRLACFDQKQTVLMTTIPESRLERNVAAKLIFNRYGDKYFLSQFWPEGTRGMSLPKSKAEREAALAANQSNQDTVVATRLK